MFPIDMNRVYLQMALTHPVFRPMNLATYSACVGYACYVEMDQADADRREPRRETARVRPEPGGLPDSLKPLDPSQMQEFPLSAYEVSLAPPPPPPVPPRRWV